MIKNTLFITLLTFSISMPLSAAQPMPPMGIPGAGQQPALNQDDMRALQEMETEVNKFYSSLSVEEQTQFNSDVEELTNVMMDMSEDELMDFFGNMFPEEDFQQPEPTPEPAPTTPEPEVKTPTKKPAQPAVPTRDIEGALKLIDDIISQTEKFLRTAQMIPELPGKIEKWVSKTKIKEWKTGLTWAILKEDIDIFNQKMHNLKERDPKTKKYRHLGNLVKNEGLFNNLMQMRTQLEKHVPNVEAPAFGLGTVSKKSRNHIRELLNAFAEAVYKLDLTTSLDKLMKQYEPRAKELREEEEGARKTALAESTKKTGVVPMRPVSGNGFAGGYGRPHTGYPGRDYQDYPQYDNYTPHQPTSYAASDRPRRGRSSRNGNEAKPTPAKATPSGSAPTAPAAPKRESEVDRMLGSVNMYLDSVVEFVDESATLTNIKGHVSDNSSVDIQLATQVLPQIISNIKKVRRNIKKVQKKIGKLDKAQQAMYGKELAETVGAHKEDLDKLRTDIQGLSTTNIKINININKRYAYFADHTVSTSNKQQQASLETIKQQVPNPVSLEELSKLINELYKEVGFTK